MIATLATFRTLSIVAILVACTATAVAFRPTDVVEEPVAAEIRFDADVVRVRERTLIPLSDEEIRRQAIETAAGLQPIGCTMRIDMTAFTSLRAP